MYDVIVVGARCAGSSTARLLARRGYRVLLVDKATFPSDTISTHYILQPGIARLHRWGLLDRLRATGCPPIYRGRFDVGPFALTGSPPPAGEIAEAYCPRRYVLDKLLVDAAVEAGVELWDATPVMEITTDGPPQAGVTGMRGRTRDGATLTARARPVDAADGMRSLVARAGQAPPHNTKPSLPCG